MSMDDAKNIHSGRTNEDTERRLLHVIGFTERI
jgi:hypothetical protein